MNHRANAAGELDLQAFEEDLVATVNTFIASRDPAERMALMKHYQKVYTDEPVRDRPDGLSGRADHQQALRQHSGRCADLHVQLG